MHPARADDEVWAWGGGEYDLGEVGVVGGACGFDAARRVGMFLFVCDEVVVCVGYVGAACAFAAEGFEAAGWGVLVLEVLKEGKGEGTLI